MVAYSRAKRLDLGRASRPVIAAARAGVHSAHALAQLRRAPRRVALEVVAVLEAVAEDHVHHAEGQRGVGAGQERQVLVGLLRRARAVGVDRRRARAPRRRASSMNGQRWTLELTMFAPQATMNRACDHRLGVEADATCRG